MSEVRERVPTPGEVTQRLAEFRAGRSSDRYFSCPIRPASLTDGLCYCHAPLYRAIPFYLRSWLLLVLLKLAFNGPKVWLLRRCGARIGRDVHIATDVWIDPLFVDLLEVGDEATVGVGAKIAFHVCTTEEFKVGRVKIGPRAVIGGFALVGPGIEIGEQAMVAAGAVVFRNVPPGATAIGNPARIVRGAGEEVSDG